MKATIELSQECIEQLQGGTEVNIISMDDETGEATIDEDNLSYAIDLMVKMCID